MQGVHIFLLCLLVYVLVTTVLSILYFGARSGRKEVERTLASAQTEFGTFRDRFSRITDVEAERDRILLETQTATTELQVMRGDYASRRATFDRLEASLRSLETSADMAEVGIHPLVFELDSHADYVAAINDNQAAQKALVSEKTAVVGQTEWTINGRTGEGRTMTNRAVRLSLRAFNNECDVLMTKITWKNLPQIHDRIEKSASAIDALNASLQVLISRPYINLKLREATLRQQEALKKQEEKEELRRQREEEREEAKAQREFAAEMKRQEQREREKATALAAARAELALASDAERAVLAERVSALEAQLSDALAARARVQSMAEVTRVGYVYVISNTGSFGERVFKVGMTRRLEPMDRIHELGDASVPFPFDVHAMVFTEDAPRLERELHAALADARVNHVNMRKEFFRADLDRVRDLVGSRFPGVPFADHPESSEHGMSRTIEEKHAVEIDRRLQSASDDVLPLAI